MGKTIMIPGSEKIPFKIKVLTAVNLDIEINPGAPINTGFYGISTNGTTVKCAVLVFMNQWVIVEGQIINSENTGMYFHPSPNTTPKYLQSLDKISAFVGNGIIKSVIQSECGQAEINLNDGNWAADLAMVTNSLGVLPNEFVIMFPNYVDYLDFYYFDNSTDSSVA